MERWEGREERGEDGGEGRDGSLHPLEFSKVGAYVSQTVNSTSMSSFIEIQLDVFELSCIQTSEHTDDQSIVSLPITV